MKQIKIEMGLPSERPIIEKLYRSCGKAMLAKGYDNWGDSYPPRSVIEEDLEARTLFCLKIGAQLAGVMVLNEKQPLGFNGVTWKFPTQKVLVVRRLAVAVAEQGQGFAKKLMAFAETFAQKEGYEAIRLDAYGINAPLLKFYEDLGYQRCKEAIYLGAELKHPFFCFEKAILKSV